MGSGCGETERDISDIFQVSADHITLSFIDHGKTEEEEVQKTGKPLFGFWSEY